jgi:hypothetical protein
MKDATYGQFICTVRPKKAEPNRTRFTVGGDRINQPGKVSAPTAEMLVAKMLFNSIISTRGAWFMTMDISNFYYTRFAWAGGTSFPVVLLCHVSFWFWQEIGFGLHTHVLRVQYSCGVVLVFWFWREIVFGGMYILSVRYLSVVSKYEHHQSNFNLRKFLLGFFILQKQ